MGAIVLNPGFIPILAALLVLAAPTTARPPIMAISAVIGVSLLLGREYGVETEVANIGVPIVLLKLDPLNSIVGIGMLIALVLIAIYSNARRNRYEDAAILLLAGGAVSALFVGDWVSFVAAASLAGLAAAWVVFVSPVENASRAGARLLIWHGLEGLLFLVGVGFHVSGGPDNSLLLPLKIEAPRILTAEAFGNAFIFAALMIRVGAPLAHVWLKDMVSHASSAGGVALSVFTTMLGVYALARIFPAEPLLVPVGAAMIAIGCFFAAGEDDLRRAAAYGMTAQAGVCVALIGVGSPLALAAAEGHAFTAMFAFALLQMTLGGVLQRLGDVRLSRFGGLARAMPVTSALMFVGGLAAAGAPLLSPYISLSVAYEAVAQWETRALWVMIAACSAALFVSLALRPALAANQPSSTSPRLNEAPFTMLLGAIVAAFFCVAVGLAPGWLYGLLPTALDFTPYMFDRVAAQFELLGSAGVAYLILRFLRVAPKEREGRVLDVDAFYRGPMAAAGRWVGVVMLRLYGTWQAGVDRTSARTGAALAAWTKSLDRPYLSRVASAAQLAAIAIVIAIIFVARR
ncbi:proton-conducting transporter membrane subunit [Terricaulis sp.]|uniref:proton-conducting transporter transmembrane domain-containing protein n=1 Tax=Terricaulis sp. TaxID=2768686 RepID=UPI003784353E